jgi:hypothetical protein
MNASGPTLGNGLTAPLLRSSLTLSTSGNGQPKGTHTVFIHKLYDMLEDPALRHLIWWLPPRFDSFGLLPGEEFSKALAQYFKHTNIASFVRQLNMYGFQKVNDSFHNDDERADGGTRAPTPTPAVWEFRHSTNQFRKGDTDSLRLIKRRLLKNIHLHKEIVNLKLIPTSKPDDEYLDYIEQQQQHFPYVQYLLPGPPHPHYAPPRHLQPPSYPPFPPPDRPMSAHLPPMGLVRHPEPLRALTPPGPPETLSAAPGRLDADVKLIELASLVQALRNELLTLQAKYDTLAQEHKKSNMDMVHMVELIERVSRLQAAAAAAVQLPLPRAPAPAAPIDRAKLRTPLGAHAAATDTSPRSAGPSFEYELSKLKSALLQRSSRQSLATNPPPLVVPQPYPLNPHYSIHAHEAPHARLHEGPERHPSVLDPLQVLQQPNGVNSCPSSFSGPLTAGSAPPLLAVTSAGSVPPAKAKQYPFPIMGEALEARPAAQQLPSVSELDQSLKSGNLPMYSLLTLERPMMRKVRSDEEEARHKRSRM